MPNSINFSAMLDDPIENIKRPPLLPMGTYTTRVKGWTPPSEGGSSNWQRFTCVLEVVAASEDVDEDQLQEYGDPSGDAIFHAFMFDSEDEKQQRDAKYGMKRFITEILLIPTEGMSLRQAMQASVGGHCYTTVEWRPRKNDPQIMDVRVKATAPIG